MAIIILFRTTNIRGVLSCIQRRLDLGFLSILLPVSFHRWIHFIDIKSYGERTFLIQSFLCSVNFYLF